jgi:uncharacterized protein (DUF2249 family)
VPGIEPRAIMPGPEAPPSAQPPAVPSVPKSPPARIHDADRLQIICRLNEGECGEVIATIADHDPSMLKAPVQRVCYPDGTVKQGEDIARID